MANLIIDERDQTFVLYEMLGVDKLCEKSPYTDFSPDMFDMILTEAQKFAVEEMQRNNDGSTLDFIDALKRAIINEKQEGGVDYL